MHKNLQFCDICGHVVVEKLLFTSTYWECKNCEEKKEAAKFVQETFSSETVVRLEPGEKLVINQDLDNTIGVIYAPGFKTTPNPMPGDLIWSYLALPEIHFPVYAPINPMDNSLISQKCTKQIDVYAFTGGTMNNLGAFMYEYIWNRREG